MGKKIGYSFGRCVRDIVDGLVREQDVELLITRTFMRDGCDVDDVIDAYLKDPRYLEGRDAKTCHKVAQLLYNSGRIVQPRQYGITPRYVPNDLIWEQVVPSFHQYQELACQAFLDIEKNCGATYANLFRKMAEALGVEIPESETEKCQRVKREEEDQ